MMRQPSSNPTLALQALGWVVSEPDRATRLLDVTGLSPAALRAGADRPETLAAVLSFLEAHEPDLIACAEALDVSPTALVRAREALEA